MRDDKKNMSSIDQVFKDQFESANIPFDPAAWALLEQSRSKNIGIFFWRKGWNNTILVLMMMVILTATFFWLNLDNSSKELPTLEAINNLKTDKNIIIKNNQAGQDAQLSDDQELNDANANVPTELPQLSRLQEDQLQKAKSKAKSETKKNSTTEENRVSDNLNFSLAQGSGGAINANSEFISDDSSIYYNSEIPSLHSENQKDSTYNDKILANQKQLTFNKITNDVNKETNKKEVSPLARINLEVDKLLVNEVSLLEKEENEIEVGPIKIFKPLYRPQNVIYVEMLFNLHVGDFQDGSLDVRPFPISLGYRWIDTRSFYSNLFLRYDYTQTDREFSTLEINHERSFNLESAYTEKMISVNTSLGLRLGKRFFLEGHGGLGLASLSKGITLRAGEFSNPDIAYSEGPDFDRFVRVSYGISMGIGFWNNDVQIFGSIFQSTALNNTLSSGEINYPQISEYECDSCYKNFDRRYIQTIDIFKITFGIRKTIF